MRRNDGWVIALIAALSSAACNGTRQAPPPSLVADPPPSQGPPGAGLGDLDRAEDFIEREAWDKAASHAKKAVASQPKNGLAHYYLALARYRLGEVEAAKQGFERALEHEAGAPADRRDVLASTARAYLAEIYLAEEPPRAADAIEVLRPVAETEDPVARQLLGYAHRLEGDFDAAAKHYQAALAAKDDPKLRFQYADALFAAERFDEAVEQMRKVLPAYQDDVEMLAALAHRFAKSGAYEDCIDAFDQAIGLEEEPGFFLHRGLCKHELDDESAAREDFERALAIDARFQPAHYYMGMSYLASEKRAQAADAFEKAVDIDGDSRVGKAAQKQLKKMAP